MSAQVQGDGIGWPDRYRPNDLESMALAPEQRERFERYLSGDALPNSLILYGPPGFGKTTIAGIIAETLYSPVSPNVMRVKSGETGNVEYIRTKVLEFMRAMPFGDGTKLVIFEEASGLSREAAELLRVPLEDFADLCRVIFITNDVAKLDAAVKSRCDVIELGRPPLAECARVLEGVLKAEGIDVPIDDVLSFTRGHFFGEEDDSRHDLRSLLRSAQHHIKTSGVLPAVAMPTIERAAALDAAWTRGGPADATDGAALLADLADQFTTYASLPVGGAEVLALWTVFAWAHEAFSISPILALVSPTPGAGKSTVLEMLEQLLVPETLHASSLTPAALYRLKGLADTDQAVPPTDARYPALCLLIDEADLQKLNQNSVMRSVLNSGHTRRGAFVHRMLSTSEVGKFSSWYPKALALIDRSRSTFPDTLRDRSIVIPMQRMRAGETKPKFPRHHMVPELAALAEQVASWVNAHFTELRELAGNPILLADATLPSRAMDNWHQLMCIARVAGGDWEERARRVSVILMDATREKEPLGELLTDIRAVFDAEGTDTIRSVVLVDRLRAFVDRPWKERGLTPIKLSQMLRALHIRPKQLWMGANKQGYTRAAFEDAFARYTVLDGDGPTRTVQ